MKKSQLFLIIVFSIIVLKYDLSAFVRPLSFESVPEIRSTDLIKYAGAGNDSTMPMVEFQNSMSLWSGDPDYADRDISGSGRI